MLYDTTTGQWRQVAQANVADPVWSRNSKAIFFHDFVQAGQPIYKLTIATGQLERVAGLGLGNVPLVNVRLPTANVYSTALR